MPTAFGAVDRNLNARAVDTSMITASNYMIKLEKGLLGWERKARHMQALVWLFSTFIH